MSWLRVLLILPRMLWFLVAFPVALIMAGFAARAREANELRLKHEVTVLTPGGEHTYGSIVSLKPFQYLNFHAGSGWGWGAITGRLTGSALRIPLADQDVYVLLAGKGGSTPAWWQIDLVKTYFGFPNADDTRAWVSRWNELADRDLAVPIHPDSYPFLAVMPANGWMNDARTISLAEAAALGLTIKRYRLVITREPVSAPLDVRYRTTPDGSRRTGIGREKFVVNGRRG